MVFEEIKVKKKSIYAAEQLISTIRDGVYKVGIKPPERVLAEEMGISRLLVREALTALAAIVESRPGDGTYVRKPLRNTDLSRLRRGLPEQGIVSLFASDPVQKISLHLPLPTPAKRKMETPMLLNWNFIASSITIH